MSDGEDGGVGVSNVLCHNDHGASGQVMESRRGGYECPECGRKAEVSISWDGGGGGQ